MGASSPVDVANALGVAIMRSNSGKGDSQNNLRDPTLRDRDLGRAAIKAHKQVKAPADHRQGRQDKSEKPHQRAR